MRGALNVALIVAGVLVNVLARATPRLQIRRPPSGLPRTAPSSTVCMWLAEQHENFPPELVPVALILPDRPVARLVRAALVWLNWP